MIQETHCTQNRLKDFKSSWQGISYYGLTDLVHSRGVGILCKPKLNIDPKMFYSTRDGRQLGHNNLITLMTKPDGQKF